jgi:parallel beta-helix repeat protein
MKKTLNAVLLAGTIFSFPVAAETITVESGSSIQSALDRASFGDVVVVQPGTYQPFEIKTNGVTVKSSRPGGAHVIASRDKQPAISAYGQSGIGVFDFRVTSRGGDGIKVGGSPGNMVNKVRVVGNVVESAALDGVKMFQTREAKVMANQIKASGAAGAAGQGGNRNGDGGIDWVQVDDSEMSDNEISSRGWACAMVKGGSRNNRIANNDMVNCEVNGIDMAAQTTGDAGAANKSGLVAYDNTIEDNEISSGGCGIKLGEKTRNIKIDNVANGGAECIAGNGNGQSAEGAGGTWGYSYGDYINEQYGSMTATLTSSSGGDVCSSGAMGIIAGAANTVISMIGGGRATAKGQQIQLVEMIRANLCAGEQNDKLEISNEHDRNNIAHGSANGTPGINGMLGRTSGNLERGGYLSDEDEVQSDYQRQFPNAFDPMSKDQLARRDIIWQNTVRDSRMNSFAIQNRSVQEQANGVARARDFAAAGKAGRGIRAELQAANAIQAEQVAAINNLTSATVASNRAATVERMRDETTKKAAHASVDEYMATLAVCGNCAISTPFLKP